jgi:hypothetical protein
MRSFILLFIAVPLAMAAVLLDNGNLASHFGVQLREGVQVNATENQVLEAVVVNPSRLAKIGLQGARKGDAIQLTLISERERKLRLLHVPSGNEVTALIAWLQKQR